MKTKFKILSFVALFFLVAVTLVPSVSAGINIYPEDHYFFKGTDNQIHHALVFDIENKYMGNNRWYPEVCGTTWYLRLLSFPHIDQNEWTFRHSPKAIFYNKEELLVPTRYCYAVGLKYNKNANAGFQEIAAIGLAAIDSNNGIYINTNKWYQHSGLVTE